jgi:hypothetical protein
MGKLVQAMGKSHSGLCFTLIGTEGGEPNGEKEGIGGDAEHRGQVAFESEE